MHYALWYFSGMVGCSLAWYVDKISSIVPKRNKWCPTPNAVFWTFICSFFGFIMLGVGVAFCVIEYIVRSTQRQKYKNFTEWWTSPLCGKD